MAVREAASAYRSLGIRQDDPTVYFSSFGVLGTETLSTGSDKSFSKHEAQNTVVWRTVGK